MGFIAFAALIFTLGLVIYNDDGTPESVAYQVLPSLLLNEHQKQSRKLTATEAKLVQTQKTLSTTQQTLSATEQRLEAVEAEMATMKLMLSKLAAMQDNRTQVASAP